MPHPEISVVMSVHDGANVLARSVESILRQEGVALELIIVNDGSTDDSGALIDDFAARDDRVLPIHQQHRGLTAALRLGCSRARGTYIARQDSGDWSEPNRLVRQLEMLARSQATVFVSCWTRYVGPKDEELWIERGGDLAEKPAKIIAFDRPWGVIGGPSHHGSVMMRRDAYERVGGYRPEFYFGQDWDLWYRLAEVGAFQMKHEVLYVAQITLASISTTHRHAQMRLARLSLAAMKARREGRDESAILDEAASIRPTARRSNRSLADGAYFVGEALRRRRDPAARVYLRQAIAARPWMLRAWVRMAQSLFTSGR